jgi:hypothetical protein
MNGRKARESGLRLKAIGCAGAGRLADAASRHLARRERATYALQVRFSARRLTTTSESLRDGRERWI